MARPDSGVSPCPTNLSPPSGPDFDDLRARLATAPLGLADIFEAGERIAALAAAAPAGVPRQRIAILGALTTDFIARAIAVAAVQEGVLPVIYQAPHGSYVQEVLDPSAGLHRFRPDLVVLAPDWRDVVDDLPVGAQAAQAAAAVADKAELFRHLWERIDALGCRIVQHTLVLPPRAWGGIAERLAPASPASQVRAINDRLLAAGSGRVSWVDMERLAGEVGSRNFAPGKFFHNARLGMENRPCRATCRRSGPPGGWPSGVARRCWRSTSTTRCGAG